MEKNEYLNQREILDLEDKNLQLRYFLGSFNTVNNEVCNYNKFWWCIARCSCKCVKEDERFIKVKEFIKKHRISNITFMRLLISRNFNNYFKSYNGDFGEFLKELDEIIKEYEIKQFPTYNNDYNDTNRLTEQELVQYINKYSIIEDSLLNKFLEYYKLTLTDFMVLAKKRKFIVMRDDNSKTQDLLLDLSLLLKEYELELKYREFKNLKDDIIKTKKLSIFNK